MGSKTGTWIALAALAVACGGSTVTVGGDSGTIGDDVAVDGGIDGPAGDAAGDAGSAACPSSAPTIGAPCPIANAQCEYGSNPNASCNVIFVCSGQKWIAPAQPACVTGTCPATYASVPVGQRCAPDGLECEYPQGTCDCTRSGPGPSRLDPAWTCIPVAQGCSTPRPRIGSACSQPGLSCNYGACSGGVALGCKDGYWQVEAVPCPL